MKKKIVVGILIFCIMCVVMAVFSACDNSRLDTQEGQDLYGRDFGEIYDIDEYADGIYSLAYEIGDTSVMGKTMIGSNCYDKVKLAVNNGNYTLTFYCKNTAFSDVRLNGELGQSIEESGMNGYRFEITRDDLNGALAMTGRVSMMNKDVAFSIKADLSKAQLIGNGAINKEDGQNQEV